MFYLTVSGECVTKVYIFCASTLCEAIQQVPLSKITVEQQADIENLRNLMFVRSEQSFIEGFDDAEIDCMIQYITGHRSISD